MSVAAVRSEVYVGAPCRVREWTATPILEVTAVGFAAASRRSLEGEVMALTVEVRPLALLCQTGAGPIVNLVLKNGRSG